MREQNQTNFNRVAKAIRYINENFKEQPSLDEVAAEVHLSPYHFQRLFTEWAGVSPKKFLQYTSVEYAKGLLNDSQATLFDVAGDTGLSGTGRLHDLFVNIEGMTPGEYKNGGQGLSIKYGFIDSPFGELIVASTLKGICYLAFIDDKQLAMRSLQALFPNARYNEYVDGVPQEIPSFFTGDWTQSNPIQLHLKGTPFQLKVWEALLKIPTGQLLTYGSMADIIQQPTASRAVGTAIGKNPIAYLIPCHRVIQASGAIGGYRWGTIRKTAMIGWEAAHSTTIY